MSEEHNEVGDSILHFLVRAANKENFNVELTLNVGGAIVTGTIVSAKEYFSALSERFEGGNEVAELLSEQFAKAGESVDTSEGSKAQFIHMKEAQVYCGDSNPTPSKGEVLWRGKLSEVDGFYLGTASSGEDEPTHEDEGKDSQSDKTSADERLDHLEESIGELVDEDDQKVKEDEEASEEKAEDEEASEEKAEDVEASEEKAEDEEASEEKAEEDEEASEEKAEDEEASEEKAEDEEASEEKAEDEEASEEKAEDEEASAEKAEDEEASAEKAEDEEASEQKNKRKSRSKKANAKSTSSSKTKAKKTSEKKD